MLPGPPTIYQSILDHPRLADFDMSSLRLAVTGAAVVPVELDPAHARGTELRDDRHRLRPHRGNRHRDDVPARRRPRDHRQHRRARHPRRRGARGRRRRRRCRPANRARWWCGATTSCRVSSTTPRRPRRRSTRTVGCTPATSACSTSAATCASPTARRTCSSSAGSTRTRPRSRARCSSTRRCRRSRWSASPTPAWARSGTRTSCRARPRRSTRTEIVAWCRERMANYKVPRFVEVGRRAAAQRERQGPQVRTPRQGGGQRASIDSNNCCQTTPVSRATGGTARRVGVGRRCRPARRSCRPPPTSNR